MNVPNIIFNVTKALMYLAFYIIITIFIYQFTIYICINSKCHFILFIKHAYFGFGGFVVFIILNNLAWPIKTLVKLAGLTDFCEHLEHNIKSVN